MSEDLAGGPTTDPASPPVLRVVRGDPSPQELAALVAVLAASGQEPDDAPAAPVSAWVDRGTALQHVPAPGPGAWRSSGRSGARTRADW